MSFDLPIAWLVVAAAAAICAVAYARGRPDIALGVLFAAASFSGLTAPSPFGSVRMEQLAILALLGLIVARRPRSIVALIRSAPIVWVFAALYLGANVASSALFAPQPLESLKIAAWLGVSMLAMLIAGVLVRDAASDLGLPRWIIAAAAVQVLVGLVAVVSQGALGTEWGVQRNDVLLGKTNGLSWEANILAINVAMALAFVVVPGALPGVSSRWRLGMLLWLALGLGLAYSRGGLLALAIAVAVIAAALAWLNRDALAEVTRARLVPLVALAGLSLVIALATIQVQAVLGRMGVGVTPDTVVIDEDIGDVPIPTGRPDRPGGSPAEPSASPDVRFVGTGDTLAVRMRNIRIGLSELGRSPLIGLGTDSFRQRHIEPSCGCSGHIANLPAAALYDAGLLGITGLAGLLATSVWATWRLRAWGYLAALIVLAVGYQVTDAIRFASNWVVLGAIFGMWTALPSMHRDRT